MLRNSSTVVSIHICFFRNLYTRNIEKQSIPIVVLASKNISSTENHRQLCVRFSLFIKYKKWMNHLCATYIRWSYQCTHYSEAHRILHHKPWKKVKSKLAISRLKVNKNEIQRMYIRMICFICNKYANLYKAMYLFLLSK